MHLGVASHQAKTNDLTLSKTEWRPGECLGEEDVAAQLNEWRTGESVFPKPGTGSGSGDEAERLAQPAWCH